MKGACRLLFISLIMLVGGENLTMAQTNVFDKWKARRIEKKMKGERRKVSTDKKIKEPRTVTRAKKEQSKREDERGKAYLRAVDENKQRHYEIQTDNVRERMKQNEKEIKAREKERKKAIRKAGRKARKKYK
ncbi:MAG: hypothetical protein KFF49_03200 [Bacteroidales bacterium]|nr:hypothetical protein [Bacteroidales bacterium]